MMGGWKEILDSVSRIAELVAGKSVVIASNEFNSSYCPFISDHPFSSTFPPSVQRNAVHSKKNFGCQADNATSIVMYLSLSECFPADAAS